MASEFKIDEKAQYVLETIRNRRSIRFYKHDPVPEKAVEAIIDAARWAPSAHNFQPTEFVVVRDNDTRKFLSEIAIGAAKSVYGNLTIEEAKAVALSLPNHLQRGGKQRQLQRISGEFYKYIYTAPVIILVCADTGSPYYEADSWMAVENMLVAAKALRLGSIATVRGVVRPGDRAKIRERVQVPQNYEIICIVLVGYPDEDPQVIKRELEELIHYETFKAASIAPGYCEGTPSTIAKKLSAKLCENILNGWDQGEVKIFAAQVVEANLEKIEKARRNGKTDDEIVDDLLLVKAYTSLRSQTMQRYGKLIHETHDDDYMSWKLDREKKNV